MKNKSGKTQRMDRTRRIDNRTLGDPKQLAPKFQQLVRAIADASEPRVRARLSHQECQELLEFYVDSEKRGENARMLYPAIFKHLKTCTDCQMSYNSLREAVDEPFSPNFTVLAEQKIELPYLTRSSSPAVANKYVRSRIAGGLLGFGYTLDPKFVSRAFASSTAFATRGELTAQGELLLLDSFAFGSRDVNVELRMRPLSTDSARFEISVVSSAPLPEPLRVNLYLNDQPYSAIIEHGRGSTQDIPLSDFENAQIRVEFEAGSVPSSSEE